MTSNTNTHTTKISISSLSSSISSISSHDASTLPVPPKPNSLCSIAFFDTNPDKSSPLFEEYFTAHWISLAFPNHYKNFTFDVFYTACNHLPHLEQMKKYDALLIGGSPLSVCDTNPKAIHTSLIPLIRGFIAQSPGKDGLACRPILGLCFGCQLLSRALLGSNSVNKMEKCSEMESSEYGLRQVDTIHSKHPFMQNIPNSFHQVMMHGDFCQVPKSWILASSKACQAQVFQVHTKDIDNCEGMVPKLSFKVPTLPIYGTQFHPEMNLHLFKEIPQISMLCSSQTSEIPNHHTEPESVTSLKPNTSATLLWEKQLKERPGIIFRHDSQVDLLTNEDFDTVRVQFLSNFFSLFLNFDQNKSFSSSTSSLSDKSDLPS